MPSPGTAKRIASRKRRAVPSSPPHASARRRAQALRQCVQAAALAHAVGERGRDLAGLTVEVDVDAVVDQRLEGDRDQRVRLRLREVLRLHAVEVGADREHEIGLVPEAAGGLGMRRQPDQARVAGREDAGRAVGGEDRRREPFGEPRDGVAGITRAAADPEERALGRVDPRERRGKIARRGGRRERDDLRRGGGAVSGGRGRRGLGLRRQGDRSRSRGRPGGSGRVIASVTAAAAALATASADSARWTAFTTGANIAAWPSVSCSTPRYSPARRRPVGMSVAMTRIGDREAHASPTAPSVFAAPGPVVVSATPSRPVARA